MKVCTVCKHDQRHAVDIDLVKRVPFRHIAASYGLSTGALQRHAHEHIPAALALARDAEAASRADDLLQQLRGLQSKTVQILYRAEQANDLRTALAAISQARQNVETLGKLRGLLQQEGTVNVTLSAEWIELKGVIIESLREHPGALQAVASAIRRRELTNGSG